MNAGAAALVQAVMRLGKWAHDHGIVQALGLG
jgi:hypothetical protein